MVCCRVSVWGNLDVTSFEFHSVCSFCLFVVFAAVSAHVAFVFLSFLRLYILTSSYLFSSHCASRSKSIEHRALIVQYVLKSWRMVLLAGNESIGILKTTAEKTIRIGFFILGFNTNQNASLILEGMRLAESEKLFLAGKDVYICLNIVEEEQLETI